MLIYLGILICVTVSNGNPHNGRRNEYESTKVLYDQKQEGGWNVHANLKNFLFVIIPAVKSTPTNSSGLSPSALEQGLLYLLSKSANPRKHHHQQSTEENSEEETSSTDGTKHFIESKSAPYQVDISKTPGGLLSKLYPKNTEDDGVLVAKSPTISLLKDPVSGRVAKALVISVPSEDIVISKSKRFKKKGRENQSKNQNISCQPGQVRDSYGNCKFFKY
ncbi:uncharacterized protein LOC123680537 [Harmonia axyridis]|uniref:uncharacterized protein LOC123680537 n=1 Tax=Harmonia axyridis TaxID=115357 RepID=UPI001E274E41|nr:uncharacterized protein LOC123680537 [Harmonia axyridis]